MPALGSSSAPRHAARGRWAPIVLRVALGLALVVGLSGLAFGAYSLWGHKLVATTGPHLDVPPGPQGGESTDSGGSTSASTSDVSGPAGTPTPSASVGAPATANPTATATTTTTYEQQVFSLTNAQRATKGCPALTWNTTLAALARAHSEDMAAKSYFDHNTPDGTTAAQRMTAAGYTFTQMAENIAAGQATPADVVATWMDNAAHRSNILNCSLKDLGVGFATGGPYGTYWTQVFGVH